MPHKLEVKGLSAWVQVNGNKLECYGTSKDTGSDKRSQKVSCWIASQENETFSVNISKATKNLSCVAYLSFDGHEISKRIMKGTDATAGWYRKVVEGYKRPFAFSSQIVDDDDALLQGNVPSHSRIGEIQIRVKRITDLKITRIPVLRNEAYAEDKILPPIQKIHETRVKAAKPPHQIALGEATSKKVFGKLRDSHRYTVKETLATFTFKYRPLDTLVEHGIAPAPDEAAAPAPAALPLSRNGRAVDPKTRQTIPKTMPRHPSSPAQVASSSRLRLAVKATTRTESSLKYHTAVSSNRAKIEGDPSASSSSVMARTPATDTTLTSEFESKPRVQGIKENPDEVEILEDEEQLLLAQLESVRTRKRKALAEPKAAASRKMLKRESSVSRVCFNPGEVIDLT